jgi:putative glutamine amidotransferase
MNKFLLTMVFTGLLLPGTSLKGFSAEGDRVPHTVLLANPTANNLEIIRFLTSNGIFDVDRGTTRFIGIYHKDQAYDFSQSEAYIREHPGAGFSLVEVTGDLPEAQLFGENGCTAEFRRLFEGSSGVLFFGGPDIQPSIYKEENLGSVVTDPGRHAFEVSFLFHLLGGSPNPGFIPFLEEKRDYLVTGFCLGMQTMNVATGGTLFQDIPTQVYAKNGPQETLETDRENLHRNYWQEISDEKGLMGINFHTIRFTSHPFFTKKVKIPRHARPMVYSSHHQSPKDIGTGFEVTALSPDGKIIEGLSHRKYPHVFGVQFHPEVPALYEDREMWKFAPDDEPLTYHQIIGKANVRFHKKYWRHIAKCLH